MKLADDGTVYVLKFPGGTEDHEFVSRASYEALKAEIAQLASAAAVERGAIFLAVEGRKAADYIPEGWRLVPVEPSREMLDAWHGTGLGVFVNHPSTRPGVHWSDHEARLVACYKAMLAVGGVG